MLDRPLPLLRVIARFTAAAAFLISTLCPSASRLSAADTAAAEGRRDLYKFGYDPHPDFVAFDPHYRETHDQLSRELEAAHAELIHQQKLGRKTFCSRQVYLEAHWLVYFTADYRRARERIADLRRMLADEKDPHDREQAESDGSFAPCCDAWWLRMDMTCDELITLARRWRKPKYPVRLLEKVNSPDRLRAYLDSLLVSDVRKTGVNNSLELNMASADLERFILWQGTPKELPTKFDLDPKLKEALLDYVDAKWQDPRTGMWGPWFRTAARPGSAEPDGSVVKTCDLSVTFHLATFHEGKDVQRWPELIETTLAMKDGRFPYGWLEEGERMSNHHNMDLARLWRMGWPHASAEQRRRVADAVSIMLDYCLHKSLQPDGSFDASDEDTLSSAFYFGVGFLHEVGYFGEANRFWIDRPFPESVEVRKRILDRMQALKLDDSEATWAVWLLRLGQ